MGRRQKLVSIIFQISLLFNFPICIRYIIPGGWVGGEEQWSLNSGEILCDGKVEELESTLVQPFLPEEDNVNHPASRDGKQDQLKTGSIKRVQ